MGEQPQSEPSIAELMWQGMRIHLAKLARPSQANRIRPDVRPSRPARTDRGQAPGGRRSRLR